jgi:glycosyltransferase involved in cell wall biosynthesis
VIVQRPYWVVYGLGLAAVAAVRRSRDLEINDVQPPHAWSDHRLRILHLIVSLGSTNTEYNEHCLPMRRDRDVSVCSFTRASVEVPQDIELFEGDGTYTGFWRILREALRAHDYDIVHVHAPRTAAVLLLVSASLGRRMTNSVATLHNSWENFKPLARPVLFLIAATFGATVSCGRSADESMPGALKRLAGSRWHVVQNGTDIDRVEAAIATMPPEADRPLGRRTVSWVGRMLKRKDPSTMLDAAAHLGEDVDVVFIGDGEELPHLRAEVERRGLDGRVRLVGLLGREDVYREIARSDVFVSTSAGEGLPVAVLEAMAAGAPVVLSDIPPHREIEGAEIRFVPVGDAAGFARAIDEVLALPVHERVALGRAGQEVVKRGFSLEAMHAGYEHVYRELMPRGSAPDREPTHLPAGAG